MAKVTNQAGYPVPNVPAVVIVSSDSHPADHPKPGSGGGGTK